MATLPAMDAGIADVVYPILQHGLKLRDRLQAGELLDVDIEQSTLKDLLEACSSNVPRGARYALICWLDELLGQAGSWGPRPWEDQSLEMALHGTSDGGWRFWDLARQAEHRAACDTLEVHFLCVMLGFRGEWRDDAAQLRDWLDSARRRIETVGALDWLQPPDLTPVTFVPPLVGRARLRRGVLLGGFALLVVLPAVLFLCLRQLS